MKKMFYVVLIFVLVSLAFGAGYIIGEIKVSKARLKSDIMLALPTYGALVEGKTERARHFLAVQLLARSEMFRVISKHPLYLFTYKHRVPSDKDFETVLLDLKSRKGDIERDASGF